MSNGIEITSWDVVQVIGAGSGQNVDRRRTDVVLVNTNGPTLDRLTLENYSQFPQYFAPHPQDPSVRFYDYDWKPREGSIQEVRLNYSNKMMDNGKFPGGGGNPFQYIANPVARPALIRRGTYAEVKRMEVDAMGNKVETAAGEMIPLMQEYHYTNFLVQKNIERPFKLGRAALKQRRDQIISSIGPDGETLYSLGLYPEAFDSIDFLNSDTVVIRGIPYAPLTLWATNFSDSEYQIEGDFVYYALSFEIRHKPSGWWRKVIHAGYLYNKAIYPAGFVGPPSDQQWDTFQKQAERIKVGNPPGYPREPVPLDSRGRPFTNNEGEIITSALGGLNPDKLVYRWFLPYQQLDFRRNLPNLNGVGVFQ